jgi:prevent-host-death family protein
MLMNNLVTIKDPTLSTTLNRASHLFFSIDNVDTFIIFCSHQFYSEEIMISVGVRELKGKLSRYIAQAKDGQEIIITDHGKDVALMIPLSKERRMVKSLMAEGRAKWSGGKPKGISGVRIKGKSLSKTVIEDRR